MVKKLELAFREIVREALDAIADSLLDGCVVGDPDVGNAIEPSVTPRSERCAALFTG